MSHVDGGVVALTGFLYQLLGVAALKAWASCEDQPPNVAAFEAHLAVERPELRNLLNASKGIAHPEAFDQDALFETLHGLAKGNGLALVQFKYSRNQDEEQIYPAELIEIIDKLVSAEERIPREMGPVADYFLVTNRKLSTGAEKNVKNAHEAPKKIPGLSESQIKGFGKLQVVEGLTLTDLRPPLERFAARLGVLPHELQEGLQSLVGAIISATVERRGFRLSNEELAKFLTGDSQAKFLSKDFLKEEMRKQTGELHTNIPHGMVRREIMDEVERVANGRALLVFVGDGGNGKTTSLHQWACSLAESENGPIIGCQMARMIGREWVSELVAKWSAVKNRRPDGAEISLERLKLANPRHTPPILHLSLDGFDEEIGDEKRTWAVDLIQLFRDIDRKESKPPPARLVVTCRSKEEFFRHYAVDSSGFGVDDQIPDFCFGAFSASEFRQLVRENLSIDWQARFFPTDLSQAREGSAFNLDPFATTPNSDGLPAIDTHVVQMLHDPMIWGGLMRMEEPARKAVLEGDEIAKGLLAERIIARFCSKSATRIQMDSKTVREALRALANSVSVAPDTWNQRQKWFEATSGVVGPGEARMLFSEAVSGGLLQVRENSEWRWRHALIAQQMLSRV